MSSVGLSLATAAPGARSTVRRTSERTPRGGAEASPFGTLVGQSAERHTVHLRAVSRESVRALLVVRSTTAVKCDGYLNTRARQVLRLVLPRPSWPSRRPAPPSHRDSGSPMF